MKQTFPTIIMDGDKLIREGVRFILSKRSFFPQICVQDFDDLEALPEDRPVLFIMLVLDPSELHSKIGRIRERYPLSRVALLAEFSNKERLSSALESGANAALLTSMTPDGLVKSLEALMSDELVVVDAKLVTTAVFSGFIEGSGISVAPEHPLGPDLRQHPAKGLSLREIEILNRIVEGDSNKLIARRFEIAEATVKAHVKAILRKIGASNRTQAAIWAMNSRLSETKENSGSLASDLNLDEAASPAIL